MSDDLQFDHVEYDEAPRLPTTCGVCEGPLGDPFWVEGGRQILCTSCKEERAGFSPPAFLMAGVVGLVAAIGAGLGWGGITWATNYNIGLIAIAAGWIVAAGIRAGAGGRGGLPYQALAAVLTYFSITVAETFVGINTLRVEEGMGWLESAISFVIALPMVLVALIPSSIQSGDVIGLLIYGFALYQAIQMTGGGGMDGPFSKD